jgi:hypothetical protein
MRLFTVLSDLRLSRLVIVGGLIIATLSVPTAATFAQEEESSDVLEVVLSGGLMVPGGGISDFGDSLGANAGSTISAQVGLFVTPEITVGIDLGYGSLGVDNATFESANHQYYNAMLYGKYYFFGESKFAPFVKVLGGVHVPKFSTIVRSNNVLVLREQSYDPALAFGAAVGALFLTSDNGGLFLEAGYQMSMSDKTSATFQDVEYLFGENAGLLTLKAGFNVFFGS